MANREKIILGLMALAIVYGLVAFVINRSSDDEMLAVEGMSSLSAIQDLAASLTSNLNHQALTPEAFEVLTQAVAEWPDSFVEQPVTYEETVDSDVQERSGELRYMGYLGTARGLIALINGRDYRVREPVAESDFVVKHILASEVILEDRRGVTITLPLEEERLLSHEGYRHEE